MTNLNVDLASLAAAQRKAGNSELADILDGLALAIEQQRAEIERLRAALEMITGERPCPDNLMGNIDIAHAALRAHKGLGQTMLDQARPKPPG